MDQSSTASRTSPGLYATTRRLSSIMSARYRPRSGSGRFSSSMSRLDGNPGFALGIMTLLSCACRSGAFLAWPGPCPASLCAGAHQRSTPVLPASSRSRLSCQVSEDRPTPDTRVPPGAAGDESDSVGQSLTRRRLLENTAQSILTITLGLEAGLNATGREAIGLKASAAIGGAGIGIGLGYDVRSAEAFGGPSRPLNRCLVNAINAREFCKRLEADLAAGKNTQESRGMVKSVLRGLSLQESLKDAVLYLPGGKRQAATDAGQSAVEYLATVVEFDAWDKLDKDWTSNVALRNMTPENVVFVRMALDASGSSLDLFLRQFTQADVEYAQELYRAYFLPNEEQQAGP